MNEQVKALIAATQDGLGADILVINAGMLPGVENTLRPMIEAREEKRDAIFVVLVTEGGDADAAYQIGAILQKHYERVVVCVAGWCKSAGTLIAICADELVVGPQGQLGPIDVQITKKDELGDRDSGLVLTAALTSLSEQAFAVFERYMMDIKKRSGGAVTFKTAADIAARLTIGMMAPIFEKIDPVRMGADQRAQNVGRDYAIRLNLRPDNLNGDDALNMLLNGYSSHSFVIDHIEASRLFTNVKDLDGHAQTAVAMLGKTAITPASQPAIFYLDEAASDDEDTDDEQAGGQVVEANADQDDAPAQQPANGADIDAEEDAAP